MLPLSFSNEAGPNLASLGYWSGHRILFGPKTNKLLTVALLQECAREESEVFGFLPLTACQPIITAVRKR